MYLQTKKKRTKFVKIPRFFYIEILYCSLCSPDFTSLHRQNLGKKFLAPPWPDPGSATAGNPYFNKKVLLRDHKLAGVQQLLALLFCFGGGLPQSYPGWGSLPVLGYSSGLGWSTPWPGLGYPLERTWKRTLDWGTPWKGPLMRDLGKNLGLGYPPCGQTDWCLWKHYLPVILRTPTTYTPHSGPKFLHFHVVFGKNWSNSRLVPPQGLMPPPGNPGSVTMEDNLFI